MNLEDAFFHLFRSRILWSVVLAWFLTQALKVLVTSSKEKKLRMHRIIEPGGMPSSHAAMVIALLTGVGVKEGVSSTLFIVTLIFSLTIIYEAIGVRKEVEEQAEILNKIMKNLSKEKTGTSSLNLKMHKSLRETLGHSPLEVLVGGVIGFLIAVFLWVI